MECGPRICLAIVLDPAAPVTVMGPAVAVAGMVRRTEVMAPAVAVTLVMLVSGTVTVPPPRVGNVTEVMADGLVAALKAPAARVRLVAGAVIAPKPRPVPLKVTENPVRALVGLDTVNRGVCTTAKASEVARPLGPVRKAKNARAPASSCPATSAAA